MALKSLIGFGNVIAALARKPNKLQYCAIVCTLCENKTKQKKNIEELTPNKNRNGSKSITELHERNCVTNSIYQLRALSHVCKLNRMRIRTKTKKNYIS